VVARDIAAAKEGKGLKAPAAPPAGAAAPAIQLPSDDKIRALYEEGSYEVVPHDNMRRVIAQRLTASTQTIPHFYLTIDCVIDTLIAAREEINASAPKNKEGKPGLQALGQRLRREGARARAAENPGRERQLDRKRHAQAQAFRRRRRGRAAGRLITPIVRNAETKSLSAISNELKDMVARARARKLKPQEYQGGTTAVSNLGMYGIKDFTAVINPPHATILAAGAGEERAIVRKGRSSPRT
jgi:pyruvate dehydrogenase E2 component (dihydrolipoamide acetyltransferase)